MQPGAVLDINTLQSNLSRLLSPYKRPALVEVVTAMPMTRGGKVLKRELLKDFSSTK